MIITGIPFSEQLKNGNKVFVNTCSVCHQANGQGIPKVFPPLAKSDYLNKDKERAVSAVVKGLIGPITVNGIQYNSAMPPWSPSLSDDDLANVLTFVYNSWGNKGLIVSSYEISAERNKK